MIEKYDALIEPDAEEWQQLDEQSAVDIVLKSHSRPDPEHPPIPNMRLHAAIHCVVENQVALGAETPVQSTLARLEAQGLNRHEAIHAIGSVLAEHLHSVLLGSGGEIASGYFTELETLSAESWRSQYSAEE